MKPKREKRAVVLVGAGASLDLGAPSTSKLTEITEGRIFADEYLQKYGGSDAYSVLKETLAGYLHGGTYAVNYEHIFHCANELQYIEPIPGAMNEFRPILSPFLLPQTVLDKEVLSGLASRMAEFIFAEMSNICETPQANLEPLAKFLCSLRRDHITRVYTTNYDDFFWQAGSDFYTGYDRSSTPDGAKFDGEAFWRASGKDSVFHLHGSVHLGFLSLQDPDDDFGTLYWFDDRATALEHSSYSGSGDQCMDGSQTMRTAVITGLDKLSCIQRQPFSHYYASMARDMMMADLIYVIGCGLRDLHVNTWLKEARRKKPRTPLILVDCWPEGFREDTEFEYEPRAAAMVHSLYMHVTEGYPRKSYGSNWTLDNDCTCAIWDRGFSAFLEAADELVEILRILSPANSG